MQGEVQQPNEGLILRTIEAESRRQMSNWSKVCSNDNIFTNYTAQTLHLSRPKILHKVSHRFLPYFIVDFIDITYIYGVRNMRDFASA